MSWSHTSGRIQKFSSRGGGTGANNNDDSSSETQFAAVPAKYMAPNRHRKSYNFDWNNDHANAQQQQEQSTFLTELESNGKRRNKPKTKKKPTKRPQSAFQRLSAAPRDRSMDLSRTAMVIANNTPRDPHDANDDDFDEEQAEIDRKFAVVDASELLKRSRRLQSARGRMIGSTTRRRVRPSTARVRKQQTEKQARHRPPSALAQQAMALSQADNALLREDLPAKSQKYGHFPYRTIQFTEYEFDTGLIEFAQLLYRKRCIDLKVTPTLDKEERFVFFLMQKLKINNNNNNNDDDDDVTILSEDGELREEELDGTVGENRIAGGTFDVSSCQLGMEGLQCCCDFLTGPLSKRYNFTKLCFRDNQVRNQGAKILATQLLSHNERVVSLDIRACRLGPEGFAVLFQALQTTPNLTYLNTSSVQCSGAMTIGLNGSSAFGKFLAESKSLTSLQVVNNNLATSRFKRVVQGLQNSKCLVHVNLASNRLGNKCILELSVAIRDLTCMESLNLSDNDIGDFAMAHFAKELAHCEHLVSLNLSKNHIGSGGLSLLTAAMPAMLSLQHLSLDENVFDDNPRSGWEISSVQGHRQRLEHIFNARQEAGLHHKVFVHPKMINSETSVLRKLTLNKAELSDAILEQLVEQLKNSKQIRRLELSFNAHVTNKTAVILADWLHRPGCPLTHLCMNENRISDSGGQSLAKALCLNSNLQLKYLDLSDTEVGLQTGKFLMGAMAKNNEFHVLLENTHIPFERLLKLRSQSTLNKNAYDSRATERHVIEIQRLRLHEAITRAAEADLIAAQRENKQLSIFLQECQDAKDRQEWGREDVEENLKLKQELDQIIAVRDKTVMSLVQMNRDFDLITRKNRTELASLQRELETRKRKTRDANKRLEDAQNNASVVRTAHTEELDQYEAMLDKNKRDAQMNHNIADKEIDRIAQFQVRLQREIKMKQLDERYRATVNKKGGKKRRKKKSSKKNASSSSSSSVRPASATTRLLKMKSKTRDQRNSKKKKIPDDFDPNETDEDRIARKIKEMMMQEVSEKKEEKKKKKRPATARVARRESNNTKRPPTAAPPPQQQATVSKLASVAKPKAQPVASTTTSVEMDPVSPPPSVMFEDEQPVQSASSRPMRPTSAVGQRKALPISGLRSPEGSHGVLTIGGDSLDFQNNSLPPQKRGSAASRKGMLWQSEL